MAKKAASKTVETKPARGRGRPRKIEKDQYFDGMEPVIIPELESAVEEYEEAKEARMACTDREVETKKTLQAVMEKHAKAKSLALNADGYPMYHARAIHKIVELLPENVTVKVRKEPKGPE